jgi:Flp pilus assembly protein TadD
MDHYWRVLLKNPANIYAANGLGIILAERGELNEAKDFFIKGTVFLCLLPSQKSLMIHLLSS